MTEPERTFSGAEARRLMRTRRKAALSTLNREDGAPHVSLVNVATSTDGTPIILISTLAWHTRNLDRDSRGALLFDDTDGLADPLAGPRVTLMGRFEKTEDPDLRRRYLARHPKAALYADFDDFAFWTMQPKIAHAVAGFGRIETLEADEVLLDAATDDALRRAETDILRRVNEDHADAIRLCAARLSGADDGDWTATSVDADGIDVSNAAHSHRLAFEHPAETPDRAWTALIALAKAARS